MAAQGQSHALSTIYYKFLQEQVNDILEMDLIKKQAIADNIPIYG